MDGLNLRILCKQDLNQVAELHCRVFTDSALTKLGVEPVRRYYDWQLTGPHDCYAVGLFDNEKMVGFCFAGVFNESLRGFLKTNKWFLIIWIMFHPWLLNNPLVKERISLSFRVIQKRNIKELNSQSKKKPSFGILSVAVDPMRQKCGMGKMIMDNVEMNALKAGYNHLHLTVHITNYQGILFYENNGWKRMLDENETWSGKMEKEIRS